MIAGLIIAIVILVIFSGIFSSADIVYAAVNQLKLKKEKTKPSKLALKFAEDYETTVTTILFCNNLVNIAATSLATLLAAKIFAGMGDGGQTLMTVIMLIVILIFGEIIPKVIGRSFSYSLSKAMAYPLYVLQIIFFPIVWVTSRVGIGISKLFIRKNRETDAMNDDILEEFVEAIEKEGVIDEDQSDLLKNAIDFKETQAYEIMTPRIDMYAIDIDDKLEDILKDEETLFRHSRIPVYKDSIDNIVGIVSTKVLLRNLLAKKEFSIESIMMDVINVPHTMGISEILELMKKTKKHVVVVKDEFGGTDGLLTMEDILEELVGEMWDEYDTVNVDYEKVKKNHYIVNGSMNIEEFFELVDLECPQDIDYTTVGGWVIDLLGRFGKKHDKLAFKNLRIEVLEAEEFTVEKIYVRVFKKKKNNK